ncbi:MAG TPA: GTP-binding protein [Acidiphilium sp.]
MKIKLIRAASMREALAEARRLMGPDALILGNRKAGDLVEVTVATDPEMAEDAGGAWRNALTFHRVPPRLVTAWAERSPDAALATSLRFGAIDFGRPVLLAGPPGAGKTLTTAKLATRLVRNGIKPTLINADGNRAGASAQLAALSRVLRAEFIDATQAGKSARKRRRSRSYPTLIDLPGMNAFRDDDMATLRAMADAVSGSVVLVLPAGFDPAESAEIAERFHAAGATALIPSRLDLSRRLGGMIAAADAAPLTLVDAGISGSVANGLEPLTPAFLAARLLDSRHNGARHSGISHHAA